MTQQIYQQWMAQLNPEQRAAVEQMAGPVMVIAGPGTGKTQLLSTRIAHMLQTGFTEAELVLCLTYTTAGAAAMRERLGRVIGSDAWRVRISTFHGWCQWVISTHPDVFGDDKLELADDLELIQIAQKVLKTVPPNSPLFDAAGAKYAPQLVHLHSVSRQESWPAHHIEHKVTQHLAQLQDDPKMYYGRAQQKGPRRYEKGDFKDWKLADEERKFAAIVAGEALLDAFQNELDAHGLLTYNDLQLRVLGALQTNENFRAGLQERHQVLFVDEFQDTSGTQWALVQQLLQGVEQPDILVVGDDDQSIYRFQGASVENILQFSAAFPDRKLVVLTRNYRSSANVLAVADGVITNNSDRLTRQIAELEKHLSAANEKYATCPADVTVAACASTVAEAVHVVASIKAAVANGTPTSEIAVLGVKHKATELVTHLLGESGIAVHETKQLDVLQDRFAEALLDVLECITQLQKSPHGGLLQVLSTDWLAVQFDENLASLAQSQTQKSSHWDALDAFETTHKAKQNMLTWGQAAVQLRAEGAFRQVLVQGVVPNALGHADVDWRLDVLESLLKHVAASARKQPDLTLRGWIKQLQDARAAGVRIPLMRVTGQQGGVHIGSLHGAKGLEFDRVHLVGCDEKTWRPRMRSMREFTFPANAISDAIAPNSESEMRRLFFVGVTRARTHLQLSYSAANDSGKPRAACVFVREALDAGAVETQPSITQQQLKTAQGQLLAGVSEPLPGLFDAARARHVLATRGLSPSAVNDYFRCPTAFYFRQIVRVPTADTHALAYGSAVHRTLEWALGQVQTPAPERIKEHFTTQMNTARGQFETDQFTQYLAQGRTHVPWFLAQVAGKFTQDKKLETKLAGTLDGVKITGRADALLLSDGVVVDFKSGKPSAKLKPDHLRQLQMYKWLLGPKARHGAIGFVRPLGDQLCWVEQSLTDDDAQAAEHDMRQVIAAVNAGQFVPEGDQCQSRKKWGNCDWCTLRESLQA